MTPYDTGTSGTSAIDHHADAVEPDVDGARRPADARRPVLGAGGRDERDVGHVGGSDRRLKTDIQKVGTHSTGLPMYAYRYKGDPKAYPKVVGPMAEDVMKIAPHAVRPMTTKGHWRCTCRPSTRSALAPRRRLRLAWARDRRARQAPGPAAAGRRHAAVARALSARMPILGALGG